MSNYLIFLSLQLIFQIFFRNKKFRLASKVKNSIARNRKRINDRLDISTIYNLIWQQRSNVITRCTRRILYIYIIVSIGDSYTRPQFVTIHDEIDKAWNWNFNSGRALNTAPCRLSLLANSSSHLSVRFEKEEELNYARAPREND